VRQPDLGFGPDPDAIWKPARRDSRLPGWIPPFGQKVIRISFRLAIVAFFLLLAVLLFYWVISFRYDVTKIAEMPERSIIFDMRGNELATLHGESRRLITREELPDFFVEALQAREDKRFFKHIGIDLAGLLRATLRNVRDLSFTQGASTLTMQLARNSFDLRERSLHRKLLEIALAVRIERAYTKDEILTAYVNRIYFGAGCHGIDEASRRYFGVSAADLTENQGALLVGIIRAPHACSPLRNLEGARRQRDEVLGRMVAEKFLTTDTAEDIAEAPLGLRSRDAPLRGNAALQAVRRHFEELIATRDIQQGGLRLRSTIHSDIQVLLETETADLLHKLDSDLEVAAVCINARSGGILGIVGGRTTESTPFNRALDARRGLGAIFTPFLYAAAAERGKQPLLDQPLRTGREVGHDDTIRLVKRLGFEGPFAAGDDLYRGGVSATPLEVVTAAATLTGGGNRPRTYFLQDLRDADLNQLFEITPSVTPALEARSAAAALAMQFPDGEPRLLTAISPAKTDLWAVSFGTRHAICIWLGHDNPRRLDGSDTILREVNKTIRRVALSLTP